MAQFTKKFISRGSFIMDAQEIKSRLKQKNLSQAEIARRCGVTLNAVRAVIHGKSTSRRIEKKLARALGMTFDDYRTSTKQQAV